MIRFKYDVLNNVIADEIFFQKRSTIESGKEQI